MKFLGVILCIHCFTLIYSSRQYLLSSSYFIKQGHVSEITDLGVFAVHKLEIQSLLDCALQCGMSLLCNAFDLCTFDGNYTCRFRSGHANLSNTTTQCELFKNTTNKHCHNGALLGAQGPCEINTDECQNYPCLNGATCTNTPGSFNCTCDAGWTGIICNEDINECLNNPCHNGGTCSNNAGSFTCTCAGGFTGALCNEVLPNIALGKSAKQSSTKSDFNAAYAVDGNRGTTFLQDKCTHTADTDINPWWRVDLLTVYSITSVRILNRGIDQYGDVAFRLQEVSVTVGLTESDVNTPCGFFAGPGKASELVVIDCTTLPRGRFVKISKTTEFLTLCEVDVFGVPV
ncbi:neurogenic locus notch homolog protein 2-like [Crassostrea angulata]|uniref:neurogenic locus notch homolog protein 2-like n=1 Tax=Magallana angulata TaxID=2784310 RepID=UPI0022B1A27A|nr:neurogenic locus notch homolog protein 2-like [Crassostrea angulata]